MRETCSLVSIIVPSYNVQAYIGNCLDCLINQTYNNIEVIIVDDGSTDKTIDIIKYYTTLDKRIKIFRQPHKGPNAARKLGLKHAIGEYVMFVDSDDCIQEAAIETLMRYFEKYKIDTIRFDGERFPVSKQLSSSDFCSDYNLKTLDTKEMSKILLTTYNLNSLCLQIYKAQLLDDTTIFDSDMIYAEDFIANLEILKKAKTMLVINNALYYYGINPNSTTRHLSKQKTLKRLSDRVRASRIAIGYAVNLSFNKNQLYEIIFCQTKMIRNSLLDLAKLRKYTKKQFLCDIKNTALSDFVIPAKCLSETENYLKTLEKSERCRNAKIVTAILKHNYDYIWKYIRIYKLYSILHEVFSFKKNKKNRISKYMRGRLGNQLFQYATIRQIQECNGNKDEIHLNFEKFIYSLGFKNELISFRVLPFKEVKHINLSTSQIIIIFTEKMIKRLYRLVLPQKYKQFRYNYENKKAAKLQRKRGIYWKEDGALKIEPTDRNNKIAIGHFESAMNFDAIRPKLLKEIQPIEPPLMKNKKLYKIIAGSESVCVSIRRGDFVENPEFAKNYNVCGEEYFHNAVIEIKKRIKNPVFIMFSDDIEWCRKNIILKNERVYYEDGTDPVWEKLRLMYSCKHFIISNSTFSWWAQYLSRNEKKVVVAPKTWSNFGYDKDIYSKTWTAIENNSKKDEK